MFYSYVVLFVTIHLPCPDPNGGIGVGLPKYWWVFGALGPKAERQERELHPLIL